MINTEVLWAGSKWLPVAKDIIEKGLLNNGFFIWAEGRKYYFEESSKFICELGSFEMEALLSEKYRLNSTEPLYKFLAKAMNQPGTEQDSEPKKGAPAWFPTGFYG